MLGMASVLLQSCVEEEDSRSALCGNWESAVSSSPLFVKDEKPFVFQRLFTRFVLDE